jgi:hypothetical protein
MDDVPALDRRVAFLRLGELMTISVHFNAFLTIGLLLFPGAGVVVILSLIVFGSWELGALAMAQVLGGLTLAAAVGMTLLGIGMNLG